MFICKEEKGDSGAELGKKMLVKDVAKKLDIGNSHFERLPIFF